MSSRAFRNLTFLAFLGVVILCETTLAIPEYQAEGAPGCAVAVIGTGSTEEQAEGECAQYCDTACSFGNDGYGACDAYIDGDGTAETCSPQGSPGSYTAVGACACYQVEH